MTDSTPIYTSACGVPVFRLLCFSCGFDIDAAAQFLDIREDKIRKWWHGKENPPEGVKRELLKEFSYIDNAARDAAEALRYGGADLPHKPAVLRRLMEILPAEITIKIV